MKIMQIVYSGLGGNSAVAFSLVEGQIKKKYNNFFIFTGIEKIKKNYIKKCKKLRINYFYIKKKKFEINFLKLQKIINKTSPDITIIHDYNVLPFKLYNFKKKNRIIYVHHSPDKTKRIIDWLAYIFNSFLADKIVLVSRRNKKDLISKINYFLFSKKVQTIENGININKYKK